MISGIGGGGMAAELVKLEQTCPVPTVGRNDFRLLKSILDRRQSESFYSELLLRSPKILQIGTIGAGGYFLSSSSGVFDPKCHYYSLALKYNFLLDICAICSVAVTLRFRRPRCEILGRISFLSV